MALISENKVPSDPSRLSLRLRIPCHGPRRWIGSKTDGAEFDRISASLSYGQPCARPSRLDAASHLMTPARFMAFAYASRGEGGGGGETQSVTSSICTCSEMRVTPGRYKAQSSERTYVSAQKSSRVHRGVGLS